MVSRGGVDHDVTGDGVFDDGLAVFEAAQDRFGTALFEFLCVGLPSHERGHGIPFCQEEVENLAPDKSWSNQEHILASRCHVLSFARRFGR